MTDFSFPIDIFFMIMIMIFDVEDFQCPISFWNVSFHESLLLSWMLISDTDQSLHWYPLIKTTSFDESV